MEIALVIILLVCALLLVLGLSRVAARADNFSDAVYRDLQRTQLAPGLYLDSGEFVPADAIRASMLSEMAAEKQAEPPRRSGLRIVS